MILPALGFITLFVLVPALYVVVLSTWHWNMLAIHPQFVGFANYVHLFRSSTFLTSLVNSVLLAGGMLVMILPIGFLLALLLNMKLRGTTVYRSILFSTYVFPLVGSGLVFSLLLNTNDGLVNDVLEKFGLHPIDWLGSSHYALLSVLIISVWQYLGYYMLIFLAGLQNVPKHLQDACTVDGGGTWATLKHVTLPSITPSIFFAVMVCLVQSFQTFDQVYVMTNGGPNYASATLTYYIFNKGFQMFDIGPAAAASVILLILLALVSFIQLKISRRWVVEDA